MKRGTFSRMGDRLGGGRCGFWGGQITKGKGQ
jgi:hypothetical protein